MSQQEREQFGRAVGELIENINALKTLGRQLTVKEEHLVKLAKATSKPRLKVADKLSAPQRSNAKAPPAVSSAVPPIVVPDSPGLSSARSDLGNCTRCKLAGGRANIVFGEGNPAAELMFIGEAPGADEDKQGRPFVGRAGQLLTKMIAAMGKDRDDVYICNILKCRPPGNRDPEADEVEACEPFLLKQIQAIQPKVIVCLGRIAVQTLLRTTTPISQLRGQWRLYHDIKLMPTFHPAYLLRSPAGKKPAWEDLQKVMQELGWPLPDKKGT